MRCDAEKDGKPIWATSGDARVTSVGGIIRKLRIDELPQLFSVLKGEMSLVGPRPERPFFVDQLTREIPFYAVRHSVKPGVTGWAQVCYHYGATVEDSAEKLQYDLYYVKNHSLFLDLVILVETVGVVITGKGAH
jgi:lipopolysaccharide/colanic/teichoic acid biosynthesis glycosyltransferase